MLLLLCFFSPFVHLSLSPSFQLELELHEIIPLEEVEGTGGRVPEECGEIDGDEGVDAGAEAERRLGDTFFVVEGVMAPNAALLELPELDDVEYDVEPNAEPSRLVRFHALLFPDSCCILAAEVAVAVDVDVDVDGSRVSPSMREMGRHPARMRALSNLFHRESVCTTSSHNLHTCATRPRSG